MPRTTYKDLYRLVDDQIDKKIDFSGKRKYPTQLERIEIAPLTNSGISDVRTAELITAVQNILSEALPSYVLEGLEVTATDPSSSSVNITAGKGSKGGVIYQLLEDVVMPVPFNAVNSVLFLNLYRDRILIEKASNPKALTFAKIIIPEPGITNKIVDTKDGTYDAYIVNFKEYKLYGNASGKFEEDTIEMLRENIGDVLADNIIGNLRLSENLKITNIAGSLELDSDSLKILNPDGFVLSEFTKDGIKINDAAGREIAKFTGTEARLGNIRVTPNSIESGNFVQGATGFQIKDDGNVEFNNLTVRGTIYATAGEIGGFTIEEDKIYANPTGKIQTGENVGEGQNGVVLDGAGLRVYDDVLGLVANFPSDGSTPTISSGIIREVTFEISTNSVIRTSDEVGDGSSLSYGILINNTGIYGCGPNQTLSEANLKVLASGDIYLKGEIYATSGVIGGVTISGNKLVGGIIEGTIIRGAIIETSANVPRIRIDDKGIYYEVTGSVGKYGTFDYGAGTLYGAGVLAKLFDTNFPVLAVLSEQNLADIRLYNRSNNPVTGSHELGDLICVNGIIKRCSSAGSPGTFQALVSSPNTTGFQSGATLGNYVNVNINGTTYKLAYV